MGSNKSWRTIVVDGLPFRWRYGKSVQIRDKDGKGYRPFLTEVTGWSWNDIERGHWKRYFSLRPEQVANYIREKILRKS